MPVEPEITWPEQSCARVLYPDIDVAIVYDHLREGSRGGVMAEMSIESGDGEMCLMGPVQVGLLSHRDLRDIAEHLTSTVDPGEGGDWWTRLSQSGHIVLHEWRRGDRAIELWTIPHEEPRWLVPGVIPEGQTTIWTADGASGKSWLALGMCVACATGVPVLTERLAPVSRTRALYLDYETDAQTQRDRLERICRGANVAVTGGIYYVQALRPFDQTEGEVRRIVSRQGIGLMVVDTLALAAGGDVASSEVAIRLMLSLRRVPCTKLLLAHISKGSRGQSADGRTAFGSVFFRNIARSEWVLHGSQEPGEDSLRVLFVDAKRNIGGKLEPFALRVGFSPDAVVFSPLPVQSDPELSEHASLPERIVNALRWQEESLSANALALEVHAEVGRVRVALHRLAERGVIERDPGNRGRWRLRDDG